MSVEGVPGIFCVQGDPCGAGNAAGACPGEQDGLQFGAYCGIVRTRVPGCKPYRDASKIIPTNDNEVEPLDCSNNAGGSVAVSVMGAGTYCAQQPVCAGKVFGACPGPESGLDATARCVRVQRHVWGCAV
ncbi:TPA: hypothetical protein N0F65_002343 [Lagenidium giganteum]|uniref:Uncharacterized protein n=1 Tax=Lagenidium giganteum TaxID=4803 RepID=A0AAV2Z2K8_9STRA|nr:TPA: hypothetical protein N0F65_002343 [Lagenidium giganteum]